MGEQLSSGTKKKPQNKQTNQKSDQTPPHARQLADKSQRYADRHDKSDSTTC